MPSCLIAIDGPSGVGKSTVARRLAARLGVAFLDTGAMYRGVAAAALDRGIDPGSHDEVGALAERLPIGFAWDADPPRLLVDDADCSRRQRDPDVTRAVRHVAANPRVRAVLVDAQRTIGRERPRLVTEGRDQGSVVFPDADVKFYLDASPEVRAARRATQLRDRGETADEERLREELVDRDRRDAARAEGPLTCSSDAIRVETSGRALEEVVEILYQHVKDKRCAAGGKP